MTHPAPQTLLYPLEPYTLAPDVYHFGTRVRSRVVLSARHLGDDLVVTPGTAVRAIGEGEVVWAGMRAGAPEQRNWGGLVIIGHTYKDSGDVFYSVYGHMTDVRVQVGDQVAAGEEVGKVAEGLTPENGWWKIPHLHFAIYLGPWTGEILPGYKRPFDGRTKFRWWREPKPFIEAYNKA